MKREKIAKIGLSMGIILIIFSLLLIVHTGYNLLNFSGESSLSDVEMYLGSYDSMNATLHDSEFNFSSSEIASIGYSWSVVGIIYYLIDSNFSKLNLVIILSTSVITFLISLLLIFQALYNLSDKNEVKKK